jgi:hypothetical protein
MATHLFSSAGPDGLSCGVPGGAVRVIPWDQIQNIGAFHRKDQRSDYAVVWLRVPTDVFPVEFTKRDPQWAGLLEGFSQYLRGFVPFEKWFPPELHPVFEKNAYGVYSRDG